MPVLSWPASLPLKPRTNTLSGGPRRMVSAFEPEQGLEITRPRVTAAIHVISFDTPSLTPQQMVVLREFFEVTTRGGALSFCLLDPRTGEAYLWKPVPGDGPYQESDIGVDLTNVSLSLVRQPGRPWWSVYCLTTVSTVPLMVLDFQNAVYGRPADKEALVDLQAEAPVLGTVDIRRTDTSGVVTTQDGVTVDGAWWAALVPASWRSIVVFPDGTF